MSIKKRVDYVGCNIMDKRKVKGIWWIIIPLVLGIILLAPGYDEFLKIRYLSEKGIRTEGKVVGVDKLHRKSLGQPIIVFKHKNGQPVKKVFDDPLGGLYKVGEIVPVLYDPEKPLIAKINTHYGMYSLVYLPLLLGSISCLLAAWFFIQRVIAIRSMG